MKPHLAKLKAFAEHPATQMATGLVLLVSGGTEVVYDFIDAEHRFRLGAHHGVAILGLIQMLGSLPAIVDGISRSLDASERRRADREGN